MPQRLFIDLHLDKLLPRLEENLWKTCRDVTGQVDDEILQSEVPVDEFLLGIEVVGQRIVSCDEGEGTTEGTHKTTDNARD